MPELSGLDSIQLFDTSMYEFGKILSNEKTTRAGLSLPEAKVVAKNIRKVMGYKMGHFSCHAPAPAQLQLGAPTAELGQPMELVRGYCAEDSAAAELIAEDIAPRETAEEVGAAP